MRKEVLEKTALYVLHENHTRTHTRKNRAGKEEQVQTLSLYIQNYGIITDMPPENLESNRNPDGTFKPGQSGNPAGRPKGETLKEFARRYYLGMTDEEKIAYIKIVEEKRPGFAWEMGEGKAKQDMDVSVDMAPKIIRLNVE